MIRSRDHDRGNVRGTRPAWQGGASARPPVSVASVACAAAVATACAVRPADPSLTGRAAPEAGLESYSDSIPGTLVRFDMIAVPGGVASVETAGGPREVAVSPFWIGRTEVTWDEYDVFAFRLDLPREVVAGGADAESRPSRPYGAPDRGFGHQGFPAIGVTFHAAVAYAGWLSQKTGRRYRLPSDAEWTLAARNGLGAAGPTAADLDALAWHAGNAGGTTHRAGSSRADALGVHDMIGNVAEWVMDADGKPVTRGGSYVDARSSVGASARARQTDDWNLTDPQIPKSRWWLSDAPFVGFRLVREP